MNRSRIKASTVYIIYSAIQSLANATMFTLFSVYMVKTVQLDPLQLVLVGTVLEGAILIFEVPTGVVADTFSRRVSVIIGVFLTGLGFLLTGAIPLLATVLIGQALWGLGYTFMSGAFEAWLSSEIGENSVGAVYIRAGQIDRVAGLAGAGAAILLGSISLQWPLLFGAGLYLGAGFFLLLFMRETAFQPRPRAGSLGAHLREMGVTLRAGLTVVRSQPVLLTLVIVELVVGAASEGFDRLRDAHLLAGFTFPPLPGLDQVAWFGIINVLGALVAIGVTALFQKRLERIAAQPNRTARLLAGLSVAFIASSLIFALSGNFPAAVLALMARGAFGSLMDPLSTTWLVQNTPSESRATVISLVGQSNAIGQVAGGPGVGAVGKRFSLRTALLLSGLLWLPLPFVYSRAGRVTSPVPLDVPSAESS